MDASSPSLRLCEQHRGKLAVTPTVSVNSMEELAVVYTPGVAEPCKMIHKDPQNVYKYTIKSHTVAVVSDGTAVLGLGDIGPEAAMPVMEGKAVLFKVFGGVDAVPVCLDTRDPEEIIRTIRHLAPSFGGINLEDISAPRCFEIENRLKQELDIPVFHDDQHGTAIVVLAALINALKVVGKAWQDVRIVINGAGAAGISICRLLLHMQPREIVLVDRQGAVCEGETWLNPVQAEMAKRTNRGLERGSLADIVQGKDVLIGVSAPGVVSREMVASMNHDAIMFAMANPVPEIMPEDALRAGARIVGTGRSDYPNQINNVLVFPGLFRGALMVQARQIVEEMKLAAAQAIAALCEGDHLDEEHIIPNVFDPRVADAVAQQVALVAEQLGLARLPGNRCL